MTHSYLVVSADQGSIRRVDYDEPITQAEIRRHLSGGFDTAEYEAGNCRVTVCFNVGGAQSGLPNNRIFREKYGDVLIGVDEQGILRGLTDREYREVENVIISKLAHSVR